MRQVPTGSAYDMPGSRRIVVATAASSRCLGARAPLGSDEVAERLAADQLTGWLKAGDEPREVLGMLVARPANR
jgi:hypothetical protein